MRTILLGDVGNRLDIADTEQQIASLNARQKASARTLLARDEQIGALKREVGL